MDAPAAETASPLEVRSYFVRKRNALAVRARFSDLFADYYLHQLQTGQPKAPPEVDALMKEALAGITLHVASRPWAETHAWTINFQQPLANFFVSGDNTTGRLAGRVFTEGVKVGEHGMFYAQAQRSGGVPRTSAVPIEEGGMLRAVERFYRQSEQRLARFFEYGPEDYVFISAQPQCDLEWLENLTPEGILTLDKDEELSLLEKRTYHWECGCNQERILRVLEPHARKGLDALFGADEFLNVTCPRCGAKYRVQREQFEAWLREREDEAP